jgi:UDP-N-acetylmuramoyl-tripeptide--D-alanyl-D-alanine ligase
MDLKISEILKVTGGRILLPGRRNSTFDVSISGISTDSRRLKKGELFVALEGERFDGNNFVGEAFKKGAIGAIVSDQKSKISNAYSQVIIQVPDTLKALGDVAGYYRSKFNVPLIAITGSCGKTMTKEITASMLSSRFKVLKSLHNYNNLIGLPLTLFDLTSEDKIAVVEMGMSYPGEIKRLTEIAQPNTAVITNVGKAHIVFFGSLENIAEAKAELFKVSPQPKISILNRDDKFFPYFLSQIDGETVTFGMNKESDFCAEKITFDSLGRASFYLNGKIKVKLPFLGVGNIYNVLASLAIASSMGVKIGEAISSLSKVELPSGRSVFYKVNGIDILDDTYNANPSSFMNLLKTVERIKTRGKKVLVLGDMLELGRDAEKEHEGAGRLISKSSVDILITVGEKTKFTAKAVSRSIKSWHLNGEDNAEKKLESLLDEGDLLIVKGSRAMKMEKLLPKEITVAS